MQLYKVPRGSRIRLRSESERPENSRHPPDHREFEENEELEFDHVDGMYSLCFDKDKQPVHLVAWSDVEVIRSGPKHED